MADDGHTGFQELLAGLDGAARAEREELLRWLVAEGYGPDEIRTAISPMMLPAGRAIGDDGTRVSMREVAESSGLALDELRELLRAQGLPGVEDPDAPTYVAADIEAARIAKGFLDAGLSFENVVAVTRVLSHGLAQAAEVMRQTVLDAVLEPGATELQLAQAYAGIVTQVAPLLGPTLDELLRLQLRHMLETEAISATERADGRLPGAREVAVAFADLVGFTRLGEALEPQDLEGVARRLADLARDVTTHPVRFVKTIGDAVMLVSPDPTALLDAMLALLAAAEAEGDELPQLRIGLALGPAVSRAGDWFGAPVNLASRITAVARPGSVLASAALHDAVGERDGVTWSHAGERRLKGVRGEVRLFRARASAPTGR